ncbi:FG-GAP repeat domain-containing protein [Streptacidiphilus neutrinimicus]|uniref:FG-GAP repeat domain-containing protein n=1 Tax=Streptacidiphilus neutrinimicus TaxID=105420 RepID=UPI0013768F34|nr:VCBS repeat-containing protein [Streptacidiphilus neutrinimicus]
MTSADVVLVFHSADPKLSVSTYQYSVLDQTTTVTDAQGTTQTITLFNEYQPVSAGQAFIRQVGWYEQNPNLPLTVTAEVVDRASGRVESSSAPTTVSAVSYSGSDDWTSASGVRGDDRTTMPLLQQTRDRYELSYQSSIGPALPAAYPTITLSAARLKAAGWTAQQFASAVRLEAGAGWGNVPQPVVTPTIGADGSLTWVLPAVDMPSELQAGSSAQRLWQLEFYATCAIHPGTISAAFQLHASDGTVVSPTTNQAIAVQRHACLTHDFTGDGKADLLARDHSGALWLYPGTGRAAAPYGTRIRVGGGWNAYTNLVAAGDLTGDGRDDLVARDTAGRLWLYRGTGQATRPFLPRVLIPMHGYHPSARLVTAGALSGDGQADMVDIGNDMVFHGTGSAADPLGSSVWQGLPLASYNAVAGAGIVDWMPWFAARDRSGVLWLVGDPYLGAPAPARVRVGGGWQIYNTILESGDTSAVGHTDLVARDAAGRLWLYTGTGTTDHAFQPRTLISVGWQAYDLLA